jgi:hypothetical protein
MDKLLSGVDNPPEHIGDSSLGKQNSCKKCARSKQKKGPPARGNLAMAQRRADPYRFGRALLAFAALLAAATALAAAAAAAVARYTARSIGVPASKASTMR